MQYSDRMSILSYPPSEVERFIRFFYDDRIADENNRISFVQANFNQHIMIQRPRDLPYQIFNHDQIAIDEILELLRSIGIDIPEGFYKGTSVYNINGILMDRGVHVSHRVLRQQIFLGSSVDPIPTIQTRHLLFSAIGNALWNFLDHSVWRERNVKYERKNHYKNIRGLDVENNNPRFGRMKHQQNLFYIAAEDFRYLFGSALEGGHEWFLDLSNEPIPPPDDSVADFWKEELSKYESPSNHKEQPHSEEITSTRIEDTAPASSAVDA